MHGTLSDERIMIPGESVNFLKVWFNRLERLDERQAIATHRGQHDVARMYAEAYAQVERRIATYTEALGAPRIGRRS